MYFLSSLPWTWIGFITRKTLMMYAFKHMCIFKVGCKFIAAESFPQGSWWDERSIESKGEKSRRKGDKLPSKCLTHSRMQQWFGGMLFLAQYILNSTSFPLSQGISGWQADTATPRETVQGEACRSSSLSCHQGHRSSALECDWALKGMPTFAGDRKTSPPGDVLTKKTWIWGILTINC